MRDHFEFLADYNRWANRRLYADAASLPETDRRRDVGIYFRSLHGTLNHLLVADRIWLWRLTGEGEHPLRLDAILHERHADLREARGREDERILDYVRGLSDADLEAEFQYVNLNGASFLQRRRDVLAHFFNHQTHHRGQAHAALTILGVKEPEPLDMIYMQRELSAGDRHE